jgi:hypothetical protein
LNKKLAAATPFLFLTGNSRGKISKAMHALVSVTVKQRRTIIFNRKISI